MKNSGSPSKRFLAVFAMREDQSAAGDGYAAEQVGITLRVRFFTQRAFAR